MTVRLERPWLEFDLGRTMRVLSWAVHRPGLVDARRILWREVRNADLPSDLDVPEWLRAQLASRGALDAVTLLTSRDITCHHIAEAEAEGARATAIVTVGLSNAEAIGTRLDRSAQDWGTINIALRIDSGEGGLSDTALLEAMSLAAAARTAAIMGVAHDLPTGRATGTGTDCIAVAAAPGRIPYAGMHTAIGEVVGRAVHMATSTGAAEWMRTVRGTL